MLWILYYTVIKIKVEILLLDNNMKILIELCLNFVLLIKTTLDSNLASS